MLRVIIAGGRDFFDYDYAKPKIKHYLSRHKLSNVEIVSGGARGADAIGERFAQEHALTCTVFEADWTKHGKAAGPIRNKEMAKYGDVLIAFWDGKSRGTKSMIQLAKEHGLKVRVVQYDPTD